MTINCLQSLKPPSDRRIAIHITLPAQRSIRSGHPWLFDNAITKQSHNGNPGDLAILYDHNRKFLAIGIYDPFSPIRVRLLQHRKPAQIDRQWFLSKIETAAKRRKPLATTGTNGYRLVHGENDGLPGLVADFYAEALVVKIYTPAWVPHLANIVPAMTEALPSKRIVLRMSRSCCARPEFLYGLEDGQSLLGPPLETTVIFKENGLLFEADLVKGQKTGFFLDQRENRARVEKLSSGKNVLNVFSYTGGFTLYAARGGASSVTSLDISRTAIAGLKRNIKLNLSNERIANCQYEYITEDAFRAMEQLARTDRKYGMVIIDPPAFAKKREEVTDALKAYSKLVTLGLRLLRKGGVLVMASCSARVKPDEFFRMVFTTAENGGRRLIETERSEHALDHPISFPEGAYLKCLFARG